MPNFVATSKPGGTGEGFHKVLHKNVHDSPVQQKLAGIPGSMRKVREFMRTRMNSGEDRDLCLSLLIGESRAGYSFRHGSKVRILPRSPLLERLSGFILVLGATNVWVPRSPPSVLILYLKL